MEWKLSAPKNLGYDVHFLSAKVQLRHTIRARALQIESVIVYQEPNGSPL